jgi:hypothetical protein
MNKRKLPPPDLHRWHRDNGRTYTAAIVGENNARVQLLYISGGRLKVTSRPKAERAYLSPIDAGVSQRKASAKTLRRLAEQPGTPRTVRDAVRGLLTEKEPEQCPSET